MAQQDGRRGAGSDQVVQASAPEPQRGARAGQQRGPGGRFSIHGPGPLRAVPALPAGQERPGFRRPDLARDRCAGAGSRAVEESAQALALHPRRRGAGQLSPARADPGDAIGRAGQLGARGRPQPGHPQHLYRGRPSLLSGFLPPGRRGAGRPARIGSLRPPDHRRGQPPGALGLRRTPRTGGSRVSIRATGHSPHGPR